MPDWREIPPTAGLPLQWSDFQFSKESFEEELATFLGTPAAQVQCSGTVALIVILTALKRSSKRQNVVIPAYTCPLVVMAILHCGLRPVLCDTAPNGFDFCPASLERVTDGDTLAVIATHLGGRVADVATAVRIAQQKGAFVIEDAAQALGAAVNGKSVGMAGDAAFYSLAAGKGLTLYEGGVVITRHDGLRKLLRETSDAVVPFRVALEMRRIVQLAGYAAFYRPSMLPFVYGLPLRRALGNGKLIDAVGDRVPATIPIHRVGRWRKSIGLNALSRLPQFLQILDSQASEGKTKLREIPDILVIDDPPDARGTWPFFMVLMPSERARDAALAALWTAGVGVSRLFIHALPDYRDLYPFDPADVPNARDFAARMLTVSNSPWLDDEAFARICSVLAVTATTA
jgi:dTDP-4-amino-4,6-dideoxygalactose transaminase